MAMDDARQTVQLKTNGSIHKMVLRRLAAVSVLVIALGVGTLLMAERYRISEMVVAQAIDGTWFLNILVLDLLEGPQPLNSARLRQRIDQLMMFRKDVPGQHGELIFAGIFDTKGNPIILHFHKSIGNPWEVARTVTNLEWSKGKAWYGVRYQLLRIHGRGHVAIVTPLRDRSGRAVGIARSLYRVSDSTLAGVWQATRRTALVLAIVVLAVAAVLYPIIIQLVRRLAQTTLNLLAANLGTLEVLGSAIAKRDSDTDEHNYRVTIYSVRLAEAAGLPEDKIRSLIKGALLHDVGKIGVRDSILLKPGQLTEEEFREMKQHVRYGLDIVGPDPWLRDAADIVGCHHEKYDGSGYDQALRGEEIPLRARIFSIADVFDALLSRRPYKPPLSFEETRAILLKGRGSHFDPNLLDTFLGIAENLHQGVTTRSAEETRQEMQAIIRSYFRRELIVALKG